MFFAKISRGVKAFRKNCRGGGPYFGFYCIFINKCFEICLRGVLYLPSPHLIPHCVHLCPRKICCETFFPNLGCSQQEKISTSTLTVSWWHGKKWLVQFSLSALRWHRHLKWSNVLLYASDKWFHSTQHWLAVKNVPMHEKLDTIILSSCGPYLKKSFWWDFVLTGPSLQTHS